MNLSFYWRINHTDGTTEIIESDSNDRLTVHSYYGKDKHKNGYRVISHSDIKK